MLQHVQIRGQHHVWEGDVNMKVMNRTRIDEVTSIEQTQTIVGIAIPHAVYYLRNLQSCGAKLTTRFWKMAELTVAVDEDEVIRVISLPSLLMVDGVWADSGLARWMHGEAAPDDPAPCEATQWASPPKWTSCWELMKSAAAEFNLVSNQNYPSQPRVPLSGAAVGPVADASIIAHTAWVTELLSGVDSRGCRFIHFLSSGPSPELRQRWCERDHTHRANETRCFSLRYQQMMLLLLSLGVNTNVPVLESPHSKQQVRGEYFHPGSTPIQLAVARWWLPAALLLTRQDSGANIEWNNSDYTVTPPQSVAYSMELPSPLACSFEFSASRNFANLSLPKLGFDEKSPDYYIYDSNFLTNLFRELESHLVDLWSISKFPRLVMASFGEASETRSPLPPSNEELFQSLPTARSWIINQGYSGNGVASAFRWQLQCAEWTARIVSDIVWRGSSLTKPNCILTDGSQQYVSFIEKLRVETWRFMVWWPLSRGINQVESDEAARSAEKEAREYLSQVLQKQHHQERRTDHLSDSSSADHAAAATTATTSNIPRTETDVTRLLRQLIRERAFLLKFINDGNVPVSVMMNQMRTNVTCCGHQHLLSALILGWLNTSVVYPDCADELHVKII